MDIQRLLTTSIEDPTAMAAALSRQPLSAVSANNTMNVMPLPGLNPQGQKRSLEQADIVESESDDSDDDEVIIITENCDQVRRKLRRFIDGGEMKLGQLHNALGVSGRSFNTFLAASGKDKGMYNNTYEAAYRFFKKREAKGIKLPTAKRAKKGEEKKIDDIVSDVHLDGEASVSVPVFDTCDGVRKKINAYLRKGGVTKAAFMREVAKTYPDGRKISPTQLGAFLSKKGPVEGNTSAAFYASYVFFEKLRIKEGKAKSNHREEMEKRHGRGGLDTKTTFNNIICHKDSRPIINSYGELEIIPAGRR